MDEDDWSMLCQAIQQRNCILFIGSEFPFKQQQGDLSVDTTLSRMLAQKLIPNTNKELYQAATDYLFIPSKAPQNLRKDTKRFYEQLQGVTSPSFDQLAKLPFPVIVDTNYGHFFADRLQAAGKKPQSNYYSYRTRKINSPENDSRTKDLLTGTDEEPLVYNLFGSADDSDSLAISENDLIDLLCSIVGKGPYLPPGLKAQLSSREKCFLFIGFGFLAKNWYFRILLRTLESAGKENWSYALECLDKIPEGEPTVLFFENSLRTKLFGCSAQDFINELSRQYLNFAGDEDRNAGSKPSVFISYRHEDFEKVSKLCEFLKAAGVDPWIDRNELDGDFERQIIESIRKTNAYLLVQSQSLRLAAENYVHLEMKHALERSDRFMNPDDFFFRGHIDGKENILTDLKLEKFHSFDLDDEQQKNLLVGAIKRSYERQKRK